MNLEAVRGSQSFITPCNDLLQFISKGEGSYNAMNNGARDREFVNSDPHSSKKYLGKELTDMTIREIMALQKGDRTTGRKLFAAGAFQIIPGTLELAIKYTGMDLDYNFTPDVQKALAISLIENKQPALGDYLNGRSDNLMQAWEAFANEWRSVPRPDTGKTYNLGDGNRAHHTTEAVREALINAREKIMGQKNNGKI